MATSIDPARKPYTNNATASDQALVAIAGNGSARQNPIDDQVLTAALPNRVISREIPVMAATAPAEAASNATPSTAFDNPSAAWMAGIRASQFAETVPAIRKIIPTEMRAVFSTRSMARAENLGSASGSLSKSRREW